MPDICDLVLDDHATFRRRFAELDDLKRASASADALDALWGPLEALLDLHAEAEEKILYPHLLDRGDNAVDETKDAIRDHNDIRDAVRRANGAETGSQEWWDAVREARESNSDHTAEEERDALSDFRIHSPDSLRDELGGTWMRFVADHAGGDIDTDNKDPGDYVANR